MADNAAAAEGAKTSSVDKQGSSRKSLENSAKKITAGNADASNENESTYNDSRRNYWRRGGGGGGGGRGGRGFRGGRGGGGGRGRGRGRGGDSYHRRRASNVKDNAKEDNAEDNDDDVDEQHNAGKAGKVDKSKAATTTAAESVTQADAEGTAAADSAADATEAQGGSSTAQKKKHKHKKSSSSEIETTAAAAAAAATANDDETSAAKKEKSKRKNKKKDKKEQQKQDAEEQSKETVPETTGSDGQAATAEQPKKSTKKQKQHQQQHQQPKDASTSDTKEHVNESDQKQASADQRNGNDKKKPFSDQESNEQASPDQKKKKKGKSKKEKADGSAGQSDENTAPREMEAAATKTKTAAAAAAEEEESGPRKSKKRGNDRSEKENKKHLPATTRQQKFGASLSNRMRHMARDRSIPIEISEYSQTGRGRPYRPPFTSNPRSLMMHTSIRKQEEEPLVLSADDGEIQQFHFASDHPYDVEPQSNESESDRVLSETVIERRHPKKELPPRICKAGPKPYLHPDDRNPHNRKKLFSPYLNPDTILKEIKQGKLIRGNLRINKRNRSDAYVTSDSLDHDIFIFGQRDRNRALEGDVVAVRLLDVEKIWNLKKDKMRKREAEKAAEKAANNDDGGDKTEESNVNGNDNDGGANKEDDSKRTVVTEDDSSTPAVAAEEDDTEQEDDPELEETGEAEEDGPDSFDEEADKSKPKYCGEIVGILDRPENQKFAGILFVDRPQNNRDQKDNNNGKAKQQQQPRLVWFKPTDKRTPLIAIPVERAPMDIFAHADKYENYLLTATITKWPIHGQHPLGEVTGFLGPVGAVVSETQAILADNQVKDVPFSNHALQSLPKTPWKIPQIEYKIRRDLRETRIFTIDPSTAKDLDDAVHILPLDDGNFEVGVHIADVSYFLRKYSPLDSEARERGTSTYLVDRVIPMLPSLLCEELCSLNPGVERLAFSVIWKMDATGNVLETWFGRTIIKSCAKLAYDDAQSVIDGNGLPKTTITMGQSRRSIEEDIISLYKLSQHMRKRRFENGALSINSIRLCFKLSQDGEPEDVWVYELKEANRLIEEFMLRANMSVAEKICSHFPDEALLRRHEPPIERRLTEFLKLSDELGYHLDGSSAGSLQASFNAIEDEDVRSVLTVMAIKPMQRAKYFCTGTLDISKYTHYALNVPLYTHFTSPIRRYADVIVHRQLDAALRNADSCGYSKKDAQDIALQCNRCRDGAKNAQDQNIELYLARYLHTLEQTQGPVIRSAVVVQVLSDAFDIIVPEYGIEKRIHTDALPLHRHAFDASSLSMDVFWKKGEPVINFAEGAEEDVPRDSAMPGEKVDGQNAIQQQYVEDDDVEDPPCPGIPVAKTTDAPVAPNEDIDASAGMQRFKVFTTFDVLIRVNLQRSPPMINVYPINPFAERP